MKRLIQCLLPIVLSATALGQETSTVQYLANEGLMVTHGDTKVLFDPLYDNGYDTYQMVPSEMVDAIFAGEPPYDGVDAVFVSHFHGDHFSAKDMLRLLRERQNIHLYAPAQAVAGMREIATDDDEDIFDRASMFDLEYGDAPAFVRKEGLLIEALHVPHSGWPTRRTDVQNIDLMILSGFCRNCLSKWYRAAAAERGVEIDYDQAREVVYGMPFPDWKAQYQNEAPADKIAAFEKAQAEHPTD